MTSQIDRILPSDPALDELRDRLTGNLFRPGDDAYDRLATPWNVAVVSRPFAVVAAADAGDVAASIRFASEHGLEVDVTCTGHGAIASDRPFLLVHTGQLDELVVDPAGSVRVGAGVQWSAVLAATAPYGLAGLVGSAPGVGVVGYLTGGGIGPLARTFGLSSDVVTAFEVVTGDGELRRATATENPALFWGLRGGKGTLGIVTAVEMNLVELREVFGGCVYFDGSDTATIVRAWRDWTAGLPEQATSSVAVMRMPAMPGVPAPLAGTVTVAVRFVWVGSEDDGRRVFTPIMNLGQPILGGVGVLPYAAIGSVHADPVDPMPTAEANTLLRSLPDEALDRFIELVGPDASCPQVIVELRHLGGALERSPHPSAYSQRDAAYSLLAIGIAAPPVIEPTTAHAASLLDAMGPWSTGGCMPNFAPSDDPAEVARKYDAETLTRLATLAETYDPRRVIAASKPVVAAAHLTQRSGIRSIDGAQETPGRR